MGLVAVDAGVEADAAENLGASFYTVGKVAGEMGNVCESLADVPVNAIGAQGPGFVPQHLARWHEPETGVSVDGCGGGSGRFFHPRLALSPRVAGDHE